MTPTLTLDGPAREFWDRHALQLRNAGILEDCDLDSFTLLCVTWGKIAALAAVPPGENAYREMVQLNNLNKQYQALAKSFGLLPRERRASKFEREETEKDTFGI